MGSKVPWTGEPPSEWGDVDWPEWVPQKIRDEVARFWSSTLGRGPSEYQRSAEASYNRMPDFGERVFLPDTGPDPTPRHRGRWVHAWNNIGRIVKDDGSVVVTSTCYYRPTPEEGS